MWLTSLCSALLIPLLVLPAFGRAAPPARPPAQQPAPAARLRVEVTSPFGQAAPATAGAAAPAVVAAGATATVALTVRGPSGTVPQVALVGDFKGPGAPLSRFRALLCDLATDEGRTKLFPALALVGQRAGEAGSSPATPEGPRVYWLRVRVPRGQAAGRYRSTLRVTAGGGTRLDVPVALEVQPFDLLGASKQYVYMGQRLWSGAASSLGAMGENGFGTLGIETDGAALWDSLAAFQARRLRGLVPYWPTGPDPGAHAAEIEATRREKQLPPLLWLFPAAQLADAARLHAAGVPTGVVLGPQDTLADPPVDTVVYPISAPYPQSLLSGTARKTSRAAEWWTWEPSSMTPAQNRLYAGFLLWRAGLTGIYLHESPDEAGEPRFPDGEGLSPSGRRGPGPGADPLAGVRQWEAVRAGIDDVRYMTTLYALLRQCKDMDRRNPMPARAEAAVAAALARLTPESPMSAVDAARREVAVWIGRLRSVVM